MRLLLAFLVLQLTNGQRERAAVYLGRGYDVIKGNPFIIRPSDGTSSNNIDPGMKPANVLNISGAKRIGLRSSANQQCKKKSIFIRSISQFQDEVLNEMLPNSQEWHEALRKFAIVGDNRTDEGKSPEGNIMLYVYEKCASKERYISKKITTPDLYNNKSIAEEFAIEGVNIDFRNIVCELPEQYSRGDAKYNKLISSFGTSVIIGTKLGTMTFRRYQAQMEAIKQMLRYGEPVIRHDRKSHTDQMFIRITDKLLNMIDKANFEDKKVGKIRWAIGSEFHLSPVELSLWNLNEVIHEDYWPNCRNNNTFDDNVNQTDECCSRLPTLNENVKRALLDYPEQLNIHFTNDKEVVYQVVWPSGTYSLFQTGSGCPAGTGFNWINGSVQHVQEGFSNVTAPPGIFPKNVLVKRTKAYESDIFSVIFLGLGPTLKYAVFYSMHTQSFCSKFHNGLGDSETAWPAGSYCLYKFGNCPPGFQRGWVFWDDNDGYNMNKRDGVYPDGVYDADTKIDFCCRKDHPASHPIILPVQKPFILMRFGGKCQAVQWANVTEASIYYDGEWATGAYPSSHFVGGRHPDNDMDSSNNKLYYCYYKYNST